MNNVVTADQFVASISGSSEVVTKFDELRAALDRARNIVCRNVRTLDRMKWDARKRLFRADTARLRDRHAEMWNAMALCQNMPIEGKPNHYTMRPDAECEAMAEALLTKFRGLGWLP